MRSDFPHDAGYQIFREGNVDLLLIKLERLNDCSQTAFEAFLGTRISNLAMTHVTEKDLTYAMYREFLQQVVMPADCLEQMYASRFARRFLSPGGNPGVHQEMVRPLGIPNLATVCLGLSHAP